VVLLPRVTEILKKQLAGRSKGWLFPSYREGHISSRQVQNILNGMATRASLQEVKRQDKAGKDRQRIRPHLLRHSFAVWSLDSGVPVGDLQDQLGHASLATTGIYLKAARTTGERYICGQDCRISSQRIGIENLVILI